MVEAPSLVALTGSAAVRVTPCKLSRAYRRATLYALGCTLWICVRMPFTDMRSTFEPACAPASTRWSGCRLQVQRNNARYAEILSVLRECAVSRRSPGFTSGTRYRGFLSFVPDLPSQHVMARLRHARLSRLLPECTVIQPSNYTNLVSLDLPSASVVRSQRLA